MINKKYSGKISLLLAAGLLTASMPATTQSGFNNFEEKIANFVNGIALVTVATIPCWFTYRYASLIPTNIAFFSFATIGSASISNILLKKAYKTFSEHEKQSSGKGQQKVKEKNDK